MEPVQKVLMICKSLPDTFAGGIQTAVWSLSGHLAQRGLGISILTAGSFREKAHRVEKEGRILEKIPYFPGRKLPFLKMLSEESAFNIQAAKWVKKHGHRYDLIHIQGRSGTPSLKYKDELPPIVATVHGSIHEELARQFFPDPLDQKFYPRQAIRWENWVWKSVAGSIVVSKALRQEIENAWGEPNGISEVITNGIEAQEPPQSGPQPGQPLLFIARLEPIKGLMDLLHAMVGLPESVTLNVIGDGSEREKAEAFVKSQQMESRVHFLGRQPQDAVRGWVKKSYAVIVPSLFEAQGIVVLEALQGGRPVIASTNGGIPEMVTNGQEGLLIDPGNPDTLREAIAWMVNHPEKTAEMGSKGLERSHFYSWERVAELTEAFYNKVKLG